LGTVGSLEQGQSVVLQTTVTYTSTGTFNLRVDVDSANAVQEVSEINNRGDISVTVTN
jgi:subtilase family serine protease